MRDANRIDGILKQLGDMWKQFPDMRLGQFILNVAKDPELYYVEDDVLLRAIRYFYFEELPEEMPKDDIVIKQKGGDGAENAGIK